MNILYGLYSPDEGEILIKGEPVRIASPGDAIARGIGMVHQHFMLIPVMTVAENIVLAVEPRRDGVLLDYSSARNPGARSGLVLRLRHRPGREDRGHQRRPAAARRDPEGALPAGGHPHPRRAHRRAHAAGGGRALRDPQEPPARGPVDHLHQPQAERGARDRRARDRAATGEADRDAPDGRCHRSRSSRDAWSAATSCSGSTRARASLPTRSWSSKG